MIRFGLFLSLLTMVISPILAGDYDSMMITMPRGDPKAGKKAFQDMQCYTCHAVQGEKSLPAIQSANPGPALGKNQAEQSTGKLATSIVMPSHKISKEVQDRMEGKLSPMGDYSEVMTLRQLVNIIAYIRDQGRENDTGE